MGFQAVRSKLIGGDVHAYTLSKTCRNCRQQQTNHDRGIHLFLVSDAPKQLASKTSRDRRNTIAQFMARPFYLHATCDICRNSQHQGRTSQLLLVAYGGGLADAVVPSLLSDGAVDCEREAGHGGHVAVPVHRGVAGEVLG